MNEGLEKLLADLYAEGAAFDAAQTERVHTRRNLEPASAGLLWSLAGIVGARRAVEIGTSNGYSAIWLADALNATGGRLVSVDVDTDPAAAENLSRAGLRERVNLHRGDGGAYLEGLSDACVDLLFLDAERTEYPRWWPHPVRVLRPGGLLVIDNVLSHPDEVAAFLELLAGESSLSGWTVPVGKGLHLAWRAH
ncbi:O-methyltransferase [Actinoplanes palleronii]|uniref:O-methyltransferase n=1 Tax=Actinoplanes palleronii TaxID=113570 RepID=A0ABQ4B3L6_9ACTN|nr:class I SAM-dependent methyltransferase [Actinoplanes palleronii]GIE65264.1 O-methyltransferase [Actinoplanes palleronii]